MNFRLAFALFPIMLFGAPVFAQSPCVDCLKEARVQLKQCLGNAISQEDKKSCAERQQDKSKTCESSACEMERAQVHNKTDALTQKK